jgi:hypothetical protein
VPPFCQIKKTAKYFGGLAVCQPEEVKQHCCDFAPRLTTGLLLGQVVSLLDGTVVFVDRTTVLD